VQITFYNKGIFWASVKSGWGGGLNPKGGISDDFVGIGLKRKASRGWGAFTIYNSCCNLPRLLGGRI
jgi:hypothetical protein